MIKLTCTYVSESGKSALFSATKNLGPVSNRLGSGFMEINEDIEVGKQIEIDGVESVRTETSTVTNDDGSTRTFDWLILE